MSSPSLTSRMRVKWILLFFRANPRFALLYLLYRMFPSRVRYDFLFTRSRATFGMMRAAKARIYTDFFHAVSYVDINLGLPYEQLGFRIEKGMKIVDVGAHHGIYSIRAALQGADRVLAIEPHPYNFKVLQRNVGQNSLSNVTILNVAASDRDGEALLFESIFSGQHTIVPTVFGPERKTVSVRCLTLDTLLSELQVDPDLLKIDCEGAELMVLEGARKILGKQKRRKVVVEIHSSNTSDVEACLKGLGFETRILTYDKAIAFAEKF